MVENISISCLLVFFRLILPILDTSESSIVCLLYAEVQSDLSDYDYSNVGLGKYGFHNFCPSRPTTSLWVSSKMCSQKYPKENETRQIIQIDFGNQRSNRCCRQMAPILGEKSKWWGQGAPHVIKRVLLRNEFGIRSEIILAQT